MPIRVSITDDHQMVLKGLEALLDDVSEIEIISTQENAKQTLDIIDNKEIDVLLLDINLPDINGIELTKQLLSKKRDLKIIALTNFEDISFVKRIIANGAKGYLLKNTNKEELIKAIETVNIGKQYLQQKLRDKLLTQSLGQIEDTSMLPKLTRREKEVLECIANELTTKEISEKLFISPKTVESHRSNIILKFGVKNSVGMVKLAIENGLL